MKPSVLLFAAFVSIFALYAQEFGDSRNAITELAKKYELREQTPPPEWSQRKDTPLFQIAWVADMHVENQDDVERNAALLCQIRTAIHPLAVVICGDSWGRGISPVERQRNFKDFLKKCLGDGIPAIVIPGDNWPQGYDEVFGANKFSFTLGGFRFICAAMDVAGSKNGCSIFYEDTMKWLENQFASAGNAPVVYIQHEPVEPPLTLSSPEIANLLDSTPNAILALAGHVHLDLAFSRKHWQQWICPTTMTTIRPTPAFKVLSFYNDAVICQNWERESLPPYKKYLPANKFLIARIPKELQTGIHKVAKFSMDDFQAMPPRPFVSDPTLDARQTEITRRTMQFAIQHALKTSRSPNTKNATKTDDN
ncbi:MAG: hypothetical protein MJ106_01040 [Lentisphaeria bacterium]|nr:hypothetical protein [Lentisphaeria bacterium]